MGSQLKGRERRTDRRGWDTTGRKMVEGAGAGRPAREGRAEGRWGYEPAVHSRIQLHLGPVSRVDGAVLVGVEEDLGVRVGPSSYAVHGTGRPVIETIISLLQH